MKKFNPFFLFLLLVLMGTTSCKKGWLCECKSGGAVIQTTPIHDLGRFGAKNVCDSYQYQDNLHGIRDVCKLK